MLIHRNPVIEAALAYETAAAQPQRGQGRYARYLPIDEVVDMSARAAKLACDLNRGQNATGVNIGIDPKLKGSIDII